MYNLHYLNALGSPRSPNQRKSSEALMHHKIALSRGRKHRFHLRVERHDWSPSETLNAQQEQRHVTWSGQGQAQSPTCSIRGSTCRSSSVQNRWPTSPDDSRQRCCGATSKCWNPLAFPAIQFRHITGSALVPASGQDTEPGGTNRRSSSAGRCRAMLS